MRLVIILLGLLVSLAACAKGSSAPKFEEGKHYVKLANPVRTLTPGKIEVTEVFWYGCGHCYSFEPQLNIWKKKLAADVELVKSPVVWNAKAQFHAKLFYTAKALKVFDKAHQRIFDLMHKERKKMVTEEEGAALFKEFGIDQEQFNKVFKSFSVTSQVQQADARARGFQVTGTPEIIVGGQYRVSSRTAGGHEGMLQVADFLIEKVRKESTKATKPSKPAKSEKAPLKAQPAKSAKPAL